MAKSTIWYIKQQRQANTSASQKWHFNNHGEQHPSLHNHQLHGEHMSTERTVYDMHAFVDGKRVEVKNAKSYMEAIKLLQAKIDAIKAAKKGAQP